MAAFNINGQEIDTLAGAIERCREIWVEANKAETDAQIDAALSKPTALDRRRAERGVEPDLAR